MGAGESKPEVVASGPAARPLNGGWKLKRNVESGPIKADDLEWFEESVPPLKKGEFLTKAIYVSLDPTDRIWMSSAPQYMDPVKPGEVMRAGTISVVVESKEPAVKVGAVVSMLGMWQKYCVATNNGWVENIQPQGLEIGQPSLLERMGCINIGIAAYMGMMEIGKPKEGETVVVSTAAGAVGSLAGQMAKIAGCRVIGIAGTSDKCEWITKELGFDGAINYKTEDVSERLKALCPDGIDVYFDNVGGSTLSAVLPLCNNFARIPTCGLITHYDRLHEPMKGPENYQMVLMRRITIQGFIMMDPNFQPLIPAAKKQMAAWLKEGKLKYRVHVVDGIEKANEAVNMLFNGTNQGKLIVKCSDEPPAPPANPRVVFVLGGPGSGKGTQCANIVRDFGYTHLSAGDLLRAHVKSGTADGNAVAEMMKQGQIVPSEVTVGLLRGAMAAAKNDKFLIDGFPRNQENRDAWEREIGMDCTGVLFFDCPEKVMEERLLGRNEGRADDNIETIRKRFKVFIESSIPVIEYYEGLNKVEMINSNRHPSDVYADVKKMFIDPDVVFVLGGPGSGKGTQCANMVRDMGYTHLSAGDLLRAHVKSGTANGNAVAEMMKQGKIVPSEVTVGLLRAAMRASGGDKFLIDGFPRNKENRDAWQREMGFDCTSVLFFDCPEEVMEKRLLGRNEGRADDNIETIRKRFKVFVESSMPVIDHYAAQGKVMKIDSNRPPEEVYADVHKVYRAKDVVFVLGGPGSGKGTQCANLVKDFGYTHLSAGDLLRAHVKSGTADGNAVAEMMKQGKIVPSEVTVGLLRREMWASGNDKFLIDGFPRNQENRDAWEREMGFDCSSVLFFDCPEEVMEKRLLGRNEGRADDNIETIRKRFKVFIESSIPVIEHYAAKGKVININSNRKPEEVYADVKELLINPRVVFVLGGPGSGKGTQCANIVRDFGYTHLSAGDLLRAHVKSGTADGNAVAEMMKQGQIVPSEVTVGLLRREMAASGNRKFLIDGFPRNQENRDAWEREMGFDCTSVLFFDCPEEVMEDRLLGRNEGRADDNIETIRKRFKVFVESSMPVVEHYDSKGKLFVVDSNKPPEYVYAESKRLFTGTQ